jgi:hypothetical protein
MWVTPAPRVRIPPPPLQSQSRYTWPTLSQGLPLASAKVGWMHERQMPPSSPRLDGPEAVRVQTLATEHWSLLAQRNIAYGAIFSRTSIF